MNEYCRDCGRALYDTEFQPVMVKVKIFGKWVGEFFYCRECWDKVDPLARVDVYNVEITTIQTKEFHF